jgi:bifunctional DNA-binding transcriptional regulator/antitoxin component of YhaV-PrlF toxin-antitoxin module
MVRRHMLVAKTVYIIQENGQVTLPIEFRCRYNLKKGDAIVFKETAEGLPIGPREALGMKLLDEIGDELEARGISLDERIASGRDIRREIFDEKYASESDD